jgi:hypothetical protein
MSLATPTVNVFMELPFDTQDVFIIDDPVRGEIDNTTYLIAGDIAVDVTSDGYDVRINRGRRFELEDNSAGTCSVLLRNLDRDYDGLNTSSPHAGHISAGLRTTVEMYGQTLFDGTVQEWEGGYEVSGYAWASFLAADGLGYLGSQEFDAWTTTGSQTAGPRIEDALSRTDVNWPAAQRDLGTGVSTLQSDNVTWGSNVLNYLQLVARSDLGNLFADRNNIVTFRDRHALVDIDPVVTFTDDGSETPFHAVTLMDGSKVMANRVGIDREGGTLQTVADDESIMMHGIRPLNRTQLLMDSDSQSADMAEFLAGAYAEPAPRISSITVNMAGLTADQQFHVASLDIADAVQVTWTPRNTGSEIDQLLEVLGIQDSIPSGGPHIRTLLTAPIAQANAFIIDEDLIEGDAVISF